jgi:4'-phosphopantetheinyl transferase
MSANPESLLFHSAPKNPDLRAGEVHLWLASLDTVPLEMCHCLSHDEQARAARFHFERDRSRFVASRAVLRNVLSSYLAADPSSLVFERGPHGKPALSGMPTTLRFNLSHSEDLLLLAVAHAREVGVDLEALRESVHFEMLSDHYFTPEDAWALRTTPVQDRAWRFFELWTRTEAQIKARGLGLTEKMQFARDDVFDVRNLRPHDGYAAALAVEGRGYDLTCWSWAA